MSKRPRRAGVPYDVADRFRELTARRSTTRLDGPTREQMEARFAELDETSSSEEIPRGPLIDAGDLDIIRLEGMQLEELETLENLFRQYQTNILYRYDKQKNSLFSPTGVELLRYLLYSISLDL